MRKVISYSVTDDRTGCDFYFKDYDVAFDFLFRYGGVMWRNYDDGTSELIMR